MKYKCPCCKKPFSQKSKYHVSRYCSNRCSIISAREKRLKKFYPEGIPIFPIKVGICRICKKDIYSNFTTKRKTCGRKCQRIGLKHTQETKDRISRVKRIGTIYPIKESICRNCKKPFSFAPNKYHPTRIFCSRKCCDELGASFGLKRTEESKNRLSEKYRREGNPTWRGGVSLRRYRGGEEQIKHTKWRKIIFERDNYTCKECGARSGHGKKITLNADHIKPYALCDEKERWDINNGQTLCKDCHRKKTNWELKYYWKNQHGQSVSLMASNKST